MIAKNLNKEYHGATKPSMDFIYKILEDAFNSGIKYDVTDMHNAVLAFAASSTNQSDYCMRLVPKMHFKSEDGVVEPDTDTKDIPIVFYDVEVFPNLFLINWKYEGAGKTIFRMINPIEHSRTKETASKYKVEPYVIPADIYGAFQTS